MNFKTIAFSFLVLGLAVGVGFFYQNDKPAQAQTGTNIAVTNYAWSSNIGWVQFDGHTNPVVINPTTGDFSGYAWSSNVGWLHFGAPGKPVAKVNSMTNPTSLSGWAQLVSQQGKTDGWDGWVNFDGIGYVPPTGPTPGHFTGYAWGDEVVGWMDMSQVVADIIPPVIDPCPITGPYGGNCTCANPDWVVTQPAGTCPSSNPYTLQVQIIGDGSVVGTGINCLTGNTPDCLESNNNSFPTTLTATPGSNQVFSGWTGCDSPSNNVCVQTIQSPGTEIVRALFDQEVCNPVTDPTCIPPIDGEEFSFLITPGQRFRVINPPEGDSYSTEITVTAKVGANMSNVTLSDSGLAVLVNIAGNSVPSVTPPKLVYNDNVLNVGDSMPLPIGESTFKLKVYFPGKARNSITGANLYNSDNRSIPIKLRAVSSVTGPKIGDIPARLQYFDPTIVQR